MTIRIKTLAPGIFTEALAENIQVHWDPIGETAVINFISGRYLRMGEDEYLSRIQSDSNVSITMVDLQTESFEIGEKVVTGADMDAFVRLLYDKLYNEQVTPTPNAIDSEIPGMPLPGVDEDPEA